MHESELRGIADGDCLSYLGNSQNQAVLASCPSVLSVCCLGFISHRPPEHGFKFKLTMPQASSSHHPGDFSTAAMPRLGCSFQVDSLEFQSMFAHTLAA